LEAAGEHDRSDRRGRPSTNIGATTADRRSLFATPVTPSGGFANALDGALNSVNASQHKAETLSAAYERGDEVDIAKVMLARQEAGVAFEATLQVRNKLLSAYQDIMRTGV
jgi:flagellar hook-basal body complex protein FliE